MENGGTGKDGEKKSLLTVLGLVVYIHTRFGYKTIKKTAYLLDRIMEVAPYTQRREEVCEHLLLKVAQSSYQKVEESLEGKDVISRESVICHVHSLTFPSENVEKSHVKRLYIEIDEDYITL